MFVNVGCSMVNVDFGFIGVVVVFDVLVVFFVVEEVAAPLSFD